MRRCLLFALTFAAVLFAQSGTAPGPKNPGFEDGQSGEVPAGWTVPKAISGFSVKLSAENPKIGKLCAEIAAVDADKPSPFGNIMQSLDATPYRGKRVRFRAAVKISTAAPDDHAQMWFRVDLPNKAMGFFENMDNRPIRVLDWQYFDITGEIESDAERINIGLMLMGKGKAWLDDVSLDILSDVPVSYVVPPTAAFDKMTEAAKLWTYVKYFHTRVTRPDIDWDQAFIDAVPKILESRNDDDFQAALNALLAPLHDPFTRAINPANEHDRSIVMTLRPGPKDALIVELTAGNFQEAEKARQALIPQLASAKAVVFDVRNSRAQARNFQGAFPIGADSLSPSVLKRVHSGYANQAPGGYQGYHSSWQIEDGPRITRTSATTLRPVFLVNSKTIIPDIAVSLQDSGGCAIISEDEISDAQAIMGVSLKAGNLTVWVRTREFEHADSTSGLTANVVLNKTGDAALDAALQYARSGTFPAPLRRTAFSRPAAVFSEKTTSKPYPGPELRLLAAARIWGVFNYFHPYKYLYGEDWDAVLPQFLPRMAAARDAREYHLAVAEMVTHTHDSHCFVSSGTLFSAFGQVYAPLELRWIENQPVVARVLDPVLAGTIHPGDILTKVRGEPVQKRIDEISRVRTASTPQSLMSNVLATLLNAFPGAVNQATFRDAEGIEHDVVLPEAKYQAFHPYRGGEVYRMLNSKIGYVDLERLTNAQVDAMFDTLQGAEAIIMDMRGYPQGTAWSIAPRLATSPAMVNAQFRTNVVSAGGGEDDLRSELFEQRIPVTNKPRYTGKTVLLIDERAISQSEHSGLMYKTANGTVFIGSLTAGANGDVTGFLVPGGIRISFSGHDVRWPDGKQLQRVGLVPDIESHPTIAGIRAGKDEVLDRAISFIEQGR